MSDGMSREEFVRTGRGLGRALEAAVADPEGMPAGAVAALQSAAAAFAQLAAVAGGGGAVRPVEDRPIPRPGSLEYQQLLQQEYLRAIAKAGQVPSHTIGLAL